MSALACGTAKPTEGSPDAQATSQADAQAPSVTPLSFTTVAEFDPTKGQTPESLHRLSSGEFITSMSLAAELATVAQDGTTKSYGSLGKQVKDVHFNGIAIDDQGIVYAGLTNGGPAPSDPTGVYKFPKGGGTGTLFAGGMPVPNGLAFSGTDLYVSDSYLGVIFKVTRDGKATQWSADAKLKGDATACGGSGLPFPIGANDIVVDGANLYMMVSDLGALVKIPIQGDGTAGQLAVVKQDCALRSGDGLVRDPKDGSFIIALILQDKLARVSSDGTISVIASGEPLDSPAGLLLESNTLYVANSALAEMFGVNTTRAPHTGLLKTTIH